MEPFRKRCFAVNKQQQQCHAMTYFAAKDSFGRISWLAMQGRGQWFIKHQRIDHEVPSSNNVFIFYFTVQVQVQGGRGFFVCKNFDCNQSLKQAKHQETSFPFSAAPKSLKSHLPSPSSLKTIPNHTLVPSHFCPLGPTTS